MAYSEEDSTHYAMKILSKRKLLRKAGLMGRGPKKGIQKEGTSPLDRVYREIAVLKKVCIQFNDKNKFLCFDSIHREKEIKLLLLCIFLAGPSECCEISRSFG